MGPRGVPSQHERLTAAAAALRRLPNTADVTTSPSQAGAKLKVAVHYATSPESSALQWLPKECTAGKKLPYLFSQCQAIHARALVPCADTPSAKFTYDAAATTHVERACGVPQLANPAAALGH